eukprot:m.62590 g.62590  ORF g.62590 m.62590 type:complete len:676 (+) comp11522_c0_seq1:106-2133(+)
MLIEASMMFSILLCCLIITVFPCSVVPAEQWDVLVYGSTPGGILSAVAAARHLQQTQKITRVALLSQREHIGGMCSGGLGQSDIGSCPDIIGGLALEFFQRNAKFYPTPQPRAPWNLEPHIAKKVFLDMMNESNVILLPPAQVTSVGSEGTVLKNITTTDNQVYTAEIFIDGTYEGDLMARSPATYTYGRESSTQYGESGAGSQFLKQPYPGIWGDIDPFDADGNLLPLLRKEEPLPQGTADKQIQAYNFRLCVTNNASLRVPFTKPSDYDPSYWELLRRFWLQWPNSTSEHKQAQAQAPSAILGAIPSTTGAKKYDANNCGYNPIHTDMIGNSWDYPEANYTQREVIWQEHVSYTKGFLWFMSSDASVPPNVRSSFANEWGYCADEFADNDYFPAQLYIREARRLVGDVVFTQNDALNKTDIGNASIGMGCYNFDSHCEERYACTLPGCTTYPHAYAAWQCGCLIPTPGLYQMPLSLLFPKKAEVTNLIVPVCSSASHVAYATVRMEPQFMILGHSAGIVAAMTLQSGNAAVQDVNVDKLHSKLISDGQILKKEAAPLEYSCQANYCILSDGQGYKNNTCDNKCKGLEAAQWLALKAHFDPPKDGIPELVLLNASILKKSILRSTSLPQSALQPVNGPGLVLHLSKPPQTFVDGYWIIDCLNASHCSSSSLSTF